MKEIKFIAGQTIDEALSELKEQSKMHGTVCFGEFNGKTITSDHTVDSAYMKVLGCSKFEHDEYLRSEREKYERKEREFKEKIPELTRMWIDEGHSILDEKYWELWDKIVPVRLGDLYKGMELECTLDIVSILNGSENIDDVFEDAKEKIISQGHSGMSWGLMMSMLHAFHENGNEFCNRLNT